MVKLTDIPLERIHTALAFINGKLRLARKLVKETEAVIEGNEKWIPIRRKERESCVRKLMELSEAHARLQDGNERSGLERAYAKVLDERRLIEYTILADRRVLNDHRRTLVYRQKCREAGKGLRAMLKAVLFIRTAAPDCVRELRAKIMLLERTWIGQSGSSTRGRQQLGDGAAKRTLAKLRAACAHPLVLRVDGAHVVPPFSASACVICGIISMVSVVDGEIDLMPDDGTHISKWVEGAERRGSYESVLHLFQSKLRAFHRLPDVDAIINQFFGSRTAADLREILNVIDEKRRPKKPATRKRTPSKRRPSSAKRRLKKP